MADMLKVLSWNIKGANLETHLDSEESTKLQRDWVCKILYSAYSSKQRDIHILISKNLNVTIHKQLSDRKGRWVAISVDLMPAISVDLSVNRCSLINIYAPNPDSLDFFADICNVVKQIGNTYVIIGGDFNQVRDPALDKSNVANTRPIHKSQVAIDVLEEELELVDIWRILHPHILKKYTFYSKIHNSYSRIDHILLSNTLMKNIVDTNYLILFGWLILDF
uniref:Endonuclease/exonuclease/phosphatase domain-containing protein n=1 Tax=Seriola dumerili TaxID=41447 RepID=A0A3B4V1L2_SERDU